MRGMTSIWLLEFGFAVLVALLGAVGGWWLRGRFPQTATLELPTDRKQLAEQTLQSLHAAAETVRSCVQQHIECIQTIRTELKESSATEPAVISSAAASILTANGLVRHQFDDIQRVLDSKQEEISDSLAYPDGLLFTFASLDRQKHVYRQVLSSLEMLAADLASEVKGHEQQLQNISDGLEDESQRTSLGVTSAITQILDATEQIQQKVEVTEKRIEKQAETVHMQAILTHTDLLTSLPNRRAIEAELQRAVADLQHRGTCCTVVFVDFDKFAEVNAQYGHQGGDVILRQAAGLVKDLIRGKDLVARFGGDTLAVLLHQTTLHDSLSTAERVRSTIESGKFSHGSRPLRVTVSLGIAQLQREETLEGVLHRTEEALQAAQQAGGNICFRHDGRDCHPVSSAFQNVRDQSNRQSLTLASWWNETLPEEGTQGNGGLPSHPLQGPLLSGRSLFASNLSRRLSEWKRGGMAVSVVVLQVDRMEVLVTRFGAHGQGFLRQVLGRLLEAATRDMDERCEFEDGLFAILLPASDEASAFAVAERLRSQVRQCKVRLGDDLWDLTASIGVAHCTTASRVMDLMLSAEAAMKHACQQGGDAVYIGQAVAEEAANTVS
jgi:diguanylate cyclase